LRSFRVLLTPLTYIHVGQAHQYKDGKGFVVCSKTKLTVGNDVVRLAPTANCQLPTANCQLPTANCQLPTANFLSRVSILQEKHKNSVFAVKIDMLWMRKIR